MIKLQRDKVAITPVFDPDKIGSIYIPDQAKSRCKQGLVKYIGPDVKTVKPGDYVFFSGYTGTVFNLKDEGLVIIMKEDSIVALVESNIWESIDVPGLYFRGRGQFVSADSVPEEPYYFTATYEQAMTLISRAITDSRKLISLKDSGVKRNEE